MSVTHLAINGQVDLKAVLHPFGESQRERWLLMFGFRATGWGRDRKNLKETCLVLRAYYHGRLVVLVFIVSQQWSVFIKTAKIDNLCLRVGGC